MHLPVLIICFMSYLTYVFCDSSCTSQRTCGKCIQLVSEKCIWCLEDGRSNKNKEARCQPETHMNKTSWCQKEHIYNPIVNNITINANFSDTIQFRPQKMTFKGRPGVPVNFNVTYKSANDFPLDVYFLMDYSFTMKKHSEMLKERAMEIFDGLRSFTKNVSLGVGSFIEKPALPFADVFVANHTTYAFKNHLSLTKDVDVFKREIYNSKYGSNYDSPEAGLDALMQVMTCEKDLNWRNGSRRIIVLATDSTYHSAGDGKLIGAIKPNDMECHLTNNEYDKNHALIYDYPSVGQINKIATKGGFLIIFAALKRVKNDYETLARKILGAKYAELKEDSNIVAIIKNAYEASLKEIPVTYEGPDDFKVTIDQDCNARSERNCHSSPKSPELQIPVSLKVPACPKDGTPSVTYNLTIGPVGLSERLQITFTVDCQCDCEKDAKKEIMSKKCNDEGYEQCGVCACNKERGGDFCEFKCSDEVMANTTRCKEAESSTICNNRGECSCGICECHNTTFTGEYCQYHDGLCPHKGNKLCAGNGYCLLGKCECHAGWSGSGCECTQDTSKCRAPFSAKLCSKRGSCVCGECVCDKVGDTQKYLGPFCDSCAECANERCEELKDYAQCNIMKEKELCDSEFDQTGNSITVNIVNKTEFKSIMGTTTKCKTELANGTFLVFKYQVDHNRGLILTIQNEVEPPPEVDIWIPIGSAIAAILLIGILTVIIWKIATNIYDKREYEKFCNEAKAQGYDVSQNPLYEEPTQSFVNPGFTKQK